MLGYRRAVYSDSTTIPIPGFKTVKQVEENAQAMQYGPLRKSQIEEINGVVGQVILEFGQGSLLVGNSDA